MRERKVTYVRRTAARGSLEDAAFGALSDPTRRAVLDLLRRGSLPAGRIATAFPISRPAISKHLRVLRRARLVRERREGRQRVYHLNPGSLRVVDEWLSHYRALWEASLVRLKDFVEEQHAREVSASRHRKPKRKMKQ